MSSSFFGRMSIWGFLSIFLLAIFLSKESNNEGRSIRLASMANISVAETNAPKATVPPKLEMMNTENPKNRTIEPDRRSALAETVGAASSWH